MRPKPYCPTLDEIIERDLRRFFRTMTKQELTRNYESLSKRAATEAQSRRQALWIADELKVREGRRLKSLETRLVRRLADVRALLEAHESEPAPSSVLLEEKA